MTNANTATEASMTRTRYQYHWLTRKTPRSRVVVTTAAGTRVGSFLTETEAMIAIDRLGFDRKPVCSNDLCDGSCGLRFEAAR